MAEVVIKKHSRIRSALAKWKAKPLYVKAILIFFFIFFCCETFTSLFPFAWVINNSVKSPDQFAKFGASALVTDIHLENFLRVFDPVDGFVSNDVSYFGMLSNSIWITFVFLIVNIGSSSLLAFCLSKYRFPGHNLLYGLMIFVQTIPIIGTGAAAYKLLTALGFINNPALIWMIWCSGFDYSAFIMYGYFKGISTSYMESARIDGANEFQIIGKIILPLAFPCMLALMITNFVGQWNNYSVVQINLRDFPNLAYGLFTYSKDILHSNNDKGMYYAALIITALPGIILYSCFQKLILANLTVGGLKG